MTTAAIVPLRSLHDGKRRLSGCLSSAERAALVQQLFLRTHAAITAAGCIDLLCVISPDPELLDWVEPMVALPLLQPGQGLNAGLEYARQRLLERQAWSSLLVVLPDLPLIQAADVLALTALSAPQTIVVAPDRHGSGTNALLLQPADAIPFCFGPQSLQRHSAVAQSRKLAVRRYNADSIAFDLDTAADLQTFKESVENVPASSRGP